MSGEKIDVKVTTFDSQGEPAGVTKENLTLNQARKRCLRSQGKFCITANSPSLCNLTPNGCRNGNPTIVEHLK